MVFQDFDLMQERRRQERRRRLKKRLIICAVSIFIVLILIVGGAFAYLSMRKSEQEEQQTQETHTDTNTTSKPKSRSPLPADGKDISQGQKLISIVCNTTIYQDECENSLKNVTKTNANPRPKDLIKSAISAVAQRLDEALAKASGLAFNSPEEKQGLGVCREVVADAKEELQASVDKVDESKNMKELPDGDVLNWLSAVMSYQETCIDAFPEGKLRSDMKSAMNSSQELTSNSLAMIKQLSSDVFSLAGASRHLLGSDGFPDWMSQEERRILKGADDKPTPNVTVAKDGSGNFSTISEALAKMPEKYEGRYVIFIKAGTYKEMVNVTKKMVNLTMYGDGSQKTIITGDKNSVDGVPTYLTATFVVSGTGFLGKAIGFRNTAGPEKHQAVAARVQADKAVFLNCRFEGFQDTLYVQTHRQFYRSCVILGTIDFIFGDAAAVFQNCDIQIRKPLENQENVVTAQGRKDKFETTGIVLQNCEIMPHAELAPAKDKFKSYLGRPWKEYSRTVVMESKIEDLIDPAGWKEWNGSFALDTLYYGEFNNNGPGAKTDGRVKWAGRKVLNKDEAVRFSVSQFLQGDWIGATGATVRMGLGS